MGKTTWTDDSGKRWNAHMSIGEATRLKSEGFDILDPNELKSAFSDSLLTIHLVCCVHKKQITESGLSDGDFAELCTSSAKVSNDAVNATVEALADFFDRLRRPALAQVVRLAISTANEAESQSLRLVQTKAKPMLERVMAREIKQLENAIDAAENA